MYYNAGGLAIIVSCSTNTAMGLCHLIMKRFTTADTADTEKAYNEDED
jgi:hypothetical protein